MKGPSYRRTSCSCALLFMITRI